jgi:enoyl-CoA hydratase
MAGPREMIEVRIVGPVALCALDNPPVNGLSLALRRALCEKLPEVASMSGVRAIALLGAGRGFSAGGDTRELGTAASSTPPGLSSHVHLAIERSPVPVIAAMHGFAIGGALETALACHYRVARAETLISLPEVGLGLLPLSGTQRLPRMVDLETAVDLILTGKRLTASTPAVRKLFDRIAPPEADLEQAVLTFAAEVLTRPVPALVRHRPLVSRPAPATLAALRLRHAQDTSAARAAVDSIAAAYECEDFDTGLTRARALYDGLERALAARRSIPRVPEQRQ